MGIGLPVIVDIAISLIFTYFILSLLASEIQNLLKTLLQWRAVHLKESIEGLLVGNNSNQSKEARELANQLYSNPLIRSLNHQAKGGIANVVRRPLRAIGKITSKENRVFGDQYGGPSKIPPAAFSGSLLRTFDFVGLYRQIVAFRLEVAIQSMVPDVDQYQQQLAEDVTAVLASFKSKNISFTTAIKDLAEDAKVNEKIFKPEIFQRYFSSPEAIERFSNKMQLSLANTIRSVRQYLQLEGKLFNEIQQELGENPTFNEAKAVLEKLRNKYPKLDKTLSPSTEQTFLTLALILTSPKLQYLIHQLPPIPTALGDNLENLADKALGKIDDLAQEATQFEKEIANWFSNSMIRAKGVYNRNSKLVAIIIAFSIAIIANADTFYMIDHFTKEKTITASVIQVIDQLPQDALQQSKQINQLSEQLLLPMGWDKATLKQQQQVQIIPLEFIPFWLQRLPGWIATGIAVSMGASFWYNLLRKLVDTGQAGEPVSETPALAAAPKKLSTPV